MKKDIKRMVEIAESLDWSVQIEDDEFLFNKYSSAGQDFNMNITADNLEDVIEKIQERCDNFDCSEETFLWLDDTGHGINGAPYDMKDVYKDMESCLEMMKELHDALEEDNR